MQKPVEGSTIMSEQRYATRRGLLRRLLLVLPLVVFALVTLTVGPVARTTIRSPYETPFFLFFFSDTLPCCWEEGNS
jgi:hypothetical protein